GRYRRRGRGLQRMRLQLVVLAVAASLAHGGHAFAESVPSPPPPGDGVSSKFPLVARATGETSFYADTDNVTVGTRVATAEIGDRYSVWKVRGQYLVDVISAASVDIVSTASQRWNEVRQAGALEASYKPGPVGARLSGAISREPDYSSNAG